MSKDLVLDDGTTLKWFERSCKTYLDGVTLVYGRRGSGKSTVVKEIMYLCRDAIPIIYVISQSSVTNDDYTGVVPPSFILSNITPEWLERLLSQQKGRALLYKNANNPENLKRVFNRVRTDRQLAYEQYVIAESEKSIIKIEQSHVLDQAEKNNKIKAIRDKAKEMLRDLYKNTIRSQRHHLSKIPDLTSEELCCVNFVDYLPHMLLIFDDCAANFKKWAKSAPSIKEIFYNGRHYKITLIITAQDDKEIDPELRKNAIVSIFTAAQLASGNFGKAANGYPKHERKRAELCVSKVFAPTGDKDKKNINKLVYIQGGDGDPFAYMVAEDYGPFKMGCSGMWTLDEIKTDSTNTGGSSQSFIDHYARL
jgi:hypothetical protein